MAKLIVEIKSKEMIKPCSPTPNHLKTLQLSFLDQFAPPVHMPFIFFYKAPISQTADNLLKKSLSKTLVQFYPLAGRIEGNSWINCNDEGVVYCDAYVLCSLAEVIENLNYEELIRLLPFAPVHENKSIVAGVQVNHFRCGGMAIGVSISHKIADAATIATFVNAWAANTGIKFDAASFFPPMNLDGMYDPESIICKERMVTRRLIFDKDTINRIREQGVDGQQEKAPTRAELVSAFLWKQFINISKAQPTPPKFFGAIQVVNLRTIKTSPIGGNCYGNLFWSAVAHAPVETETKYPEAIAKLRTAVKQIDKNYLEQIKTGECLLEMQNDHHSFSQGEANLCSFSSCIRFQP
ncbi:hypothetical protein RND81_01G139000 [Saponaria officinalis]|uniref:Uncharacterized protein n=1 Tax=Saponaria officinalis TaxID=3572 RepID=A0AAW1NF58_SAPOF